MKAELISFGFIIGGPEGATYVSSREEIEPKIAELSAAEQHDSDDYTATEVFAKGWTGIVIPEVLESTRPRNWDESFQSSLPTLSAVAPPCMALIGEAQIRAENEALTGCTWFRSAIPPGTPIYAASPAAPAQPEGGDAAEDRFEQFVAAGIANSPEPLRELGEYLSRVLDEDKFPAADHLLLQLATSYTRPAPAQQACPAAVGHPHCKLTLTRSVAPDTFWHWIVLMPDGHPYDMQAGMTFEAALADMQTRGVVALDAADTIWRAQQAQAAALASNAAASAADAQEGSDA